MTKAVNIYFEDEEMEKLKKAKGDISWHDFVLNCCLNTEVKDGGN